MRNIFSFGWLHVFHLLKTAGDKVVPKVLEAHGQYNNDDLAWRCIEHDSRIGRRPKNFVYHTNFICTSIQKTDMEITISYWWHSQLGLQQPTCDTSRLCSQEMFKKENLCVKIAQQQQMEDLQINQTKRQKSRRHQHQKYLTNWS